MLPVYKCMNMQVCDCVTVLSVCVTMCKCVSVFPVFHVCLPVEPPDSQRLLLSPALCPEVAWVLSAGGCLLLCFGKHFLCWRGTMCALLPAALNSYLHAWPVATPGGVKIVLGVQRPRETRVTRARVHICSGKVTLGSTHGAEVGFIAILDRVP